MDDPIAESIATTISSGISIVKAYRMYSKASLEAVATRAGLSVMRLLTIEAGSASTRKELQAIAEALGLAIEALEFRETEQPAA